MVLFHGLEGSSRSHYAISLMHAANDPFLPPAALPRRTRLPAAVTLEVSRRGGHAGFVHGAPPGRLDWLPRRLLAHFAAHLPAPSRVR